MILFQLLASHQNLQLACRGLLLAAKGKILEKTFSALPSFNVDNALALGLFYFMSIHLNILLHDL